MAFTADQIAGEDPNRYAPVFSRLSALLASTRGPVLVAIDGRCGSGKTTLADEIRQTFPCQVFHMDDYYLPFEERDRNWPEGIAGNMDLIRIREEILLPVRAGKPVFYRPYDCRSRRFRPISIREPVRLNIMEGSYSHHPSLRDLYDLTIFLTLDGSEQERRLRLREGQRFEGFANRWIPMEERYFAAFDIQASSDCVFTNHPFPD